jgi:serine/threonine protein phosphatase 1
MRFLKALSKWTGGRGPAQKGPSAAALMLRDFDDGPVWAVGDVHGCAVLYKRLERAILTQAEKKGERCSIVLLGDVVDRGSQTAELLDHLIATPPKGLTRTFLLGNHEEMLLRFFDHPKQELRWLEFGGYETLSSYGLTLDMDIAARMSDRKLRQLLDAHVPRTHLEFLRGFSAGMIFGNYVLVHASVDADRALENQTLRTLLWGDPPEVAPPGMTVVHGHTVVADPLATRVRISVDTGAWRTSRLTAVRLHARDEPLFLWVANRDGDDDGAPATM